MALVHSTHGVGVIADPSSSRITALNAYGARVARVGSQTEPFKVYFCIDSPPSANRKATKVVISTIPDGAEVQKIELFFGQTRCKNGALTKGDVTTKDFSPQFYTGGGVLVEATVQCTTRGGTIVFRRAEVTWT